MPRDLRKRYGFLSFLQGTPTADAPGEELVLTKFIVDG